MAYDSSNKKLFIDNTDPDNPKGITLAEISRCLGDYRKDTRGNIDLGMMCTSPKIKIWSKNKPVRHPSFAPLTDLQREEVDYGLDVSSAHDSNWEFLLNKAIESECKFQYLRPRGLGGGYEEPYRQLDFDGYNHKAQAPYTVRWNHSKGNAFGWMEVYESENVDLRLSDLTPTILPSEDMLLCHLVILYRKEGQSNVQGVIFPKIDGNYITLDDIENSESAPIARFDLPSEGTYHMVAAITDATEESLEDMFWMFLPEGYYSTIYNPNYTGFVWEYAEDYWIRGVDANGKTIHDTETDATKVEMETKITVDKDYAKPITGNVRFRVGNYSSDGYFETTQEFTRSFYISPGSSDNFYIEFTNFDDRTIDGIYLEADIQYKDANAEEYETAYFDFINNEVKWNYQTPVTVLDVMENNPN